MSRVIRGGETKELVSERSGVGQQVGVGEIVKMFGYITKQDNDLLAIKANNEPTGTNYARGRLF